jgi:hypothetical protein
MVSGDSFLGKQTIRLVNGLVSLEVAAKLFQSQWGCSILATSISSGKYDCESLFFGKRCVNGIAAMMLIIVCRPAVERVKLASFPHITCSHGVDY